MSNDLLGQICNVMNEHHATRGGRKKRPSRPREVKVGLVPLWQIQPSPENDALYKPVDPSDPDIIGLAHSMKKRGVLEPLVISTDDFIVSGQGP